MAVAVAVAITGTGRPRGRLAPGRREDVAEVKRCLPGRSIGRRRMRVVRRRGSWENSRQGDHRGRSPGGSGEGRQGRSPVVRGDVIEVGRRNAVDIGDGCRRGVTLAEAWVVVVKLALLDLVGFGREDGESSEAVLEGWEAIVCGESWRRSEVRMRIDVLGFDFDDMSSRVQHCHIGSVL